MGRSVEIEIAAGILFVGWMAASAFAGGAHSSRETAELLPAFLNLTNEDMRKGYETSPKIG